MSAFRSVLATIFVALSSAHLAAEEQRPQLASAEPGPPVAARASAVDFRALAHAEARRAGLPGEVADAVMAVESGYDPHAVGTSGEIGLMQVMPSTARMLGFAGGVEALAEPSTNIHYGVTYLAGAWRLAGGDICTAAMKYRAGHGETRFSRLSVDYCLAVRSKLAARGYQVTGAVPIATFGDPPRRGALGAMLASRCRRDCLSASSRGPDFNAINAGFDHLVAQASASAVRLR